MNVISEKVDDDQCLNKNFLDMLKNWDGGWQESPHWLDEGKQLSFTILTINILIHPHIDIPLWRNDALNKVTMNNTTYLSKQAINKGQAGWVPNKLWKKDFCWREVSQPFFRKQHWSIHWQEWIQMHKYHLQRLPSNSTTTKNQSSKRFHSICY